MSCLSNVLDSRSNMRGCSGGRHILISLHVGRGGDAGAEKEREVDRTRKFQKETDRARGINLTGLL